MNLSPKHEAARLAACRIPALTASLALLELQNPDPARIEFYTDPVPTVPGAAPTGTLVATIPLSATAGSVNAELFQVQLTVPLEAQITGADAVNGSTVTWARLVDGDGDWCADSTVSDEAGSGEIKLQTTLLYNGAFLRLTSAVFQG